MGTFDTIMATLIESQNGFIPDEFSETFDYEGLFEECSTNPEYLKIFFEVSLPWYLKKHNKTFLDILGPEFSNFYRDQAFKAMENYSMNANEYAYEQWVDDEIDRRGEILL